MPRGRKGPPQDSIDSILLALSRREDIDPNTLSHYLDRLDEEWTEGARDKVLHLLRTSNLMAHSAAILILSELATDFDLEELEDFIADPTVGDLAKLTLAPVLKELGSEMADDGIIEYLNDPEAAMLQMQTRLLEMVGQSEMGVETILEDVLSMPVERRLGFINWLGNSHDPRATKLLIPLLETPTSKVVAAAIDALEQLGPVAAQQTIPALNYLITNSSNRQLKQHARATVGRLTMQLAPGEDEANRAAPQSLPLHEARVSFIDGSGAQMIMISWRREDGLLKGVNILYQDQWGIKDCFGTDVMEEDGWSELVESLLEEGFGNFQVSLEYCRALIAEARAINKRTRHKLPVGYAIWRPFIEGEGASKKNFLAKLEPVAYSPELAPLVQRGGELFDLPEFESWMFEPLKSIQKYFSDYLTLRNDIEGERRSRKRKSNSKSSSKSKEQKIQEQEDSLESLVTKVIVQVVDNEWRTLYEARLRRQGALLQLVGRTDDVQLLNAVAAALNPDSNVPAQEQAFLRTMIHRSLASGFFRLMTEAIENAKPLTSSPQNVLSRNTEDDFFF